MGILDKAKAAVIGDDVQAAFKDQDRLQKALTALGERRTLLGRELRDASAPLGGLSLDESAAGRKAYDSALASVEKLERDLRRNADAQAEMRTNLQAINARITELTHAERIRTLARIAKERQSKVDALQDALVAFVDKYQAFYNGTEKFVLAFPQVADSIGLDLRRLPDAIAIELFRLWPVGAISRNAPSKMPGAHSGLGLEAPATITPLVDAVRQENAAAVSNFKTSVTLVVEAAPSADDPDKEILGTSPNLNGTIDARTIPLPAVHLTVGERK